MEDHGIAEVEQLAPFFRLIMSLFKLEKAVPNKFLALYLQRRNFLFHFLIVIPVKDVLDRKEDPRFFDPFL